MVLKGMEHPENLVGKFLVFWDRHLREHVRAQVAGYDTQTNRYRVTYTDSDNGRVDYLRQEQMLGWSICNTAEARDEVRCLRVTAMNYNMLTNGPFPKVQPRKDRMYRGTDNHIRREYFVVCPVCAHGEWCTDGLVNKETGHELECGHHVTVMLEQEKYQVA